MFSAPFSPEEENAAVGLRSYSACHGVKLRLRPNTVTQHSVHLLHYLQLHVWMLFQQHQHEEDADGKCVGSRNHHLQHALPDIIG